MTELAEGTAEILDYWFGAVGPENWWTRSDATDATITERFGALWEEWKARPATDFLVGPREALAGVVLFDQFPRAMFRGKAEAFSTDMLAYAIAQQAIEQDLDEQFGVEERSFLYMPFQHSEELIDQDHSVDLFSQLAEAGYETPLDYALKHRDMIVRFGRFPARNAALGRDDRPQEAEAIAESRDW